MNQQTWLAAFKIPKACWSCAKIFFKKRTLHFENNKVAVQVAFFKSVQKSFYKGFFLVSMLVYLQGPIAYAKGVNTFRYEESETSTNLNSADVQTPSDFNMFAEVADPVGQLVDSQFQMHRELMPVRDRKQEHATDTCDLNLQDKNRFADRIASAVETKMHLSQAGIGYVSSYYGMSSRENTYVASSLISHSLCEVSQASLSKTLGRGKVPSAKVINMANVFARRMNQYRLSALNGSREGYVKASRLWSKLMMCTAYTESLTSADTSTSDRVAATYAPSDYRRPASVLFYEDPYQSRASRLNVGLFQFTPNAAGNILSCIQEWNTLHPNCSVANNASQAEMIRLMGSSLQTFNAFCGVAKVTGTFAVQINTTRSGSTHPTNLVQGHLLPSDQRCVSLHFAAAKAYNHFGPFQNTTGSNLEEVLNCTLHGEY